MTSLAAYLLIIDLYCTEKNGRCSRKGSTSEEEGAQDDLQLDMYSDLVGEAIDMICDSSKSKRLGGLEALSKYLIHHFESAEIEKNESTLESVLFGCLRRGKVEERCKAANVLGMSLAFSESVFLCKS